MWNCLEDMQNIFAKTNQQIIIFYFSGKNPFCLFQGLCKLITCYFTRTWKLPPSSTETNIFMKEGLNSEIKFCVKKPQLTPC